ncbi:hypothetical protein RTCIAT899_PC03725 (plasmid) [Rhizobium tropici CIAT 899]|nr:hypothetical protein RTCIAT899_PC03725 [Rhizobium tropici CIAT 899]
MTALPVRVHDVFVDGFQIACSIISALKMRPMNMIASIKMLQQSSCSIGMAT